jgi:hypothetical protein
MIGYPSFFSKGIREESEGLVTGQVRKDIAQLPSSEHCNVYRKLVHGSNTVKIDTSRTTM